MDKNRDFGTDIWEQLQQETSYAVWCGFAFEAVCFKHIDQIRKGLKIKTSAGASVWRYQPGRESKEKGAQIDLIIDRKDRIINLCEIKFYSDVFTIDKAYAKVLQQKIDVFSAQTKPKKTLLLTFISSFGVYENDYFNELVQQSITMDALFVAPPK